MVRSVVKYVLPTNEAPGYCLLLIAWPLINHPDSGADLAHVKRRVLLARPTRETPPLKSCDRRPRSDSLVPHHWLALLPGRRVRRRCVLANKRNAFLILQFRHAVERSVIRIDEWHFPLPRSIGETRLLDQTGIALAREQVSSEYGRMRTTGRSHRREPPRRRRRIPSTPIPRPLSAPSDTCLALFTLSHLPHQQPAIPIRSHHDKTYRKLNRDAPRYKKTM